MSSFKNIISALLLGCLFFTIANGQPTRRTNAGEIQHALKKLTVLGSALYVAAHPDDENTTVLAWLSNGRMMETAYLSLTRGDGGQNLIGNEKGDLLGVIRTQELLAARRIDGPRQFFTRAVDFGYSKSPEEALSIWGKETILADVVWTIRKFRPDVIITRFTQELGGHGHHRASAILAEEAFHAAADPRAFPAQLKYVDVWQPKRLLWDDWRRDEDISAEHAELLISHNVGEFNPLLGKSYSELAALSRSQHKCQGFGATAYRGARLERFYHTAGTPASEDLFDDVNTSWQRVPGGEKIGAAIEVAYKNFDPANPTASIPALVAIDKLMDDLSDNHWVKIKQQALRKIIQDCLGIWVEAIAEDYSTTPGEALKVTAMAINPSRYPAVLKKVHMPAVATDTMLTESLSDGKRKVTPLLVKIPENMIYSHPYWLRLTREGSAFNIADQEQIGIPENQPELYAVFEWEIDGRTYTFDTPVLYRWRDPVAGERYRPLEILPPVMVNFESPLHLFSGETSRSVRLKIIAASNNVSGKISLSLPAGWRSDQTDIPFSFSVKGEEATHIVQISAPSAASSELLKATVDINEHPSVARSITRISYDHIPVQTLLPEASTRLIKLDLQKEGNLIGYVMGSGDDLPEMLRQIGYEVDLLSDDALETENLSGYDAIITGIRAYNTRQRLKLAQKRLMEYVYNGGTLIIQYNTAHRLVTEELGPYPLRLSRDRVTLESAPVNFINPEHPLMTSPNRIEAKDMDDWVQERGLYFPNQWDEKYQPLFAMNDPGESEKTGSLLYAEYGKGVYIYSGISWFRQLPAGVQGAYRLFVNMISAGKEN